jgi:hypothetical protein
VLLGSAPSCALELILNECNQNLSLKKGWQKCTLLDQICNPSSWRNGNKSMPVDLENVTGTILVLDALLLQTQFWASIKKIWADVPPS